MKNTLLLLLLPILAFSQGRFDGVEIKTEKLSENIYMLEGAGGNIGVLTGEDGTLMVDSQFADLSEKIKVAIDAISTGDIAYLVNTHWHGDHTGGNGNFNDHGATIVAHENVRERVSTDQVMKAFGREVKASPKNYWPEITFAESMDLHVNGQDIMIIHVDNAHTDGDAFVYFVQANILHMGDVFFKDRFPFIDLGSGGTINGYIEAVQAALMISDSETQIIPGHGSLASKTDLNNYLSMLHTMKLRVETATVEGKTVEEMKTAGLDKDYESWGTGFIKSDVFINTIWTDLDRENNSIEK